MYQTNVLKHCVALRKMGFMGIPTVCNQRVDLILLFMLWNDLRATFVYTLSSFSVV